MQIRIIAVGRMKKGPEQELFVKYMKRAEEAGKNLHFYFQDTLELSESKAKTPVERQKQEGEMILKKIAKGASVLLDEGGKKFTSRQFADWLMVQRADGCQELDFIIGGPDGFSPTLRESTPITLSLGPMTLPHGLARIILAEQLYRATTILNRHPYHRD